MTSPSPRLGRRLLLAAASLPLLDSCASPLPPVGGEASDPAAAALLAAAAQSQGAAAFAGVQDIAVRYDGQWRGLVQLLQPVLVDFGHRGASEDRLMPQAGLQAQSFSGPAGHKEVVRRTPPGGPAAVQVWFNGVSSTNREQLDAAALVADAYGLFLLGPLLLTGPWAAQRRQVLARGAPEWIEVGGENHECDVVRIRLEPGLGRSPGDELAVYLGRTDRLMHRVRFTMNGLESTQGAVAQVDCWAYAARAGIRWPTRFHEHLLRPMPLPVHDWQVAGLEVNRGFTAADIGGPELTGRATATPPALPSSADGTSLFQ